MNAEQLNTARLARWSQNGEARLTLEAAREWLNTIGFCPYLPGLAGAAPTASFVEAVVGRPAQTPSAGERSRAADLLARMIENVAGVPMKLGSSLGEQPDFVASVEALRYIYALRGNRNFKTGPSTVGNDKVTPLALHCWQAIQEHGPLDVPALQPLLGRDMTEAAIARALQELWTGLYVFPILSTTGKPAKWELLSRRFPQQVAAGASTGHAESQSAMVSIYLHAVVAAAEEEVLAFLSPLAPQSKLREVIRGLGSMRQLDIIDIHGRAHVCLQGGLLPEMVAQLSEEQLGMSNVEAEPEREPEPERSIIAEGGIEIERAPMQTERPARSYGDSENIRKFVPKKFAPKKFAPRDSASDESAPKRFGMQASGQRSSGAPPSRPVRPRSPGDYPPRPRAGTAYPRTGGASKTAGGFRSGAGDARRFDSSNPPTRGLGERAKRWEKSGERPGERDRERPARSSSARPGGARPYAAKSAYKPSGFKSGGDRPAKPWASKSAGSYSDLSKGGSFKPAPSCDRDAKPWTPRASSGSDETTPRGRSPREGRFTKDAPPKRWVKSTTGGRPAGGRPFAGKSSGFKPSGFQSDGPKPWASKTRGSAAPPRDGEERPKRWEKPDAGSAPRKPFGARPAGKTYGKPGGFKPGGSKFAKTKPAGAKPWVSKGAESRVGSARSYAERTGGKPAGKKPFGQKPWAARATVGAEGAAKPRRREKPEGDASGPTGGKSGAKPFWAKNPRGGKGSVAASRTNRARGGKTGGKKAGKKK